MSQRQRIHPARDLFVDRLRQAFPGPSETAQLATITTGAVPLGDVMTPDAWAAAAGADDRETPTELLVEEAAKLFSFWFDSAMPGGSWTTELVVLHDGTIRAFAFLMSTDTDPVALARLDAVSPDELAALEEELFLEVVASRDVMYFPTEVNAAVDGQLLERGLHRLLKWQKKEYGAFQITVPDVLSENATDDELVAFVRAFLGRENATDQAPERKLDWIATGSCEGCGEKIVLGREPHRWSHASGVDPHEAKRVTAS